MQAQTDEAKNEVADEKREKPWKPNRALRRSRPAKHSRTLMSQFDLRFKTISWTKRNPWTVREERRARAKRAKQARKINR